MDHLDHLTWIIAIRLLVDVGIHEFVLGDGVIDDRTDFPVKSRLFVLGAASRGFVCHFDNLGHAIDLLLEIVPWSVVDRSHFMVRCFLVSFELLLSLDLLLAGQWSGCTIGGGSGRL